MLAKKTHTVVGSSSRTVSVCEKTILFGADSFVRLSKVSQISQSKVATVASPPKVASTAKIASPTLRVSVGSKFLTFLRLTVKFCPLTISYHCFTICII